MNADQGTESATDRHRFTPIHTDGSARIGVHRWQNLLSAFIWAFISDASGLCGSDDHGVRLGGFNGDLGDGAEAMRLSTQSMVVWQQIGDPYGIANALNQLGDLALDRSELQVARDQFEGALALYRELQDRSGIAQTYYLLARVDLRRLSLLPGKSAERFPPRFCLPWPSALGDGSPR